MADKEIIEYPGTHVGLPAESGVIRFLGRSAVADGTVHFVMGPSEGGTLRIYSANASSVMDYWWSCVQAEAVPLAEVIEAQKRQIDYTGHYNAFLLGQISKDEFTEIASTYAYEPVEVDPAELAGKIGVLFRWTQADFTPSELRDIFQCDEESIRAATDRLSPLMISAPPDND